MKLLNVLPVDKIAAVDLDILWDNLLFLFVNKLVELNNLSDGRT